MASRSPQAQQKDHPVARGPTPDAGALLDRFLIFRIDGGLFGLRLATVAEITRLPDLTRMPLVPSSLLGLANLRGTVLPVVSLRQLLGLPDAAANDAARVVVMRGDAAVGFVVDRVDRLLVVPTDQFEQDAAGAGAIDPALLSGIIKGAEGESTIRILNPQRLLAGKFERLGFAGERTSAVTALPVAGAAVAPQAQAPVSLISFDLGQQEYALPLERVREIIPLPDHVSEVPRSETAVVGVITLRDRLLPLVSLRTLLGLPVDDRQGHRGKVVVVSMGEGVVGVVADATREILRINLDQIDPAPALLSRGEGDAEIVSICRLEQGRRLVALLSPDHLFRSDVASRILAEQGSAASPVAEQTEASAMADEQFVIFRLGDQDYGMPIASVSEIARPPAHITRLPKAPAFIDGVMNLRGGVVPIIDLRRRFDLVGSERTGSQRILVLAIGQTRAGFLVDSVSEVMKVATDAIRPAPELSADQMRLISRVANLEAKGRMILLVDPAQLLDQVETDVLTKFERSKAAQATTAT